MSLPRNLPRSTRLVRRLRRMHRPSGKTLIALLVLMDPYKVISQPHRLQVAHTVLLLPVSYSAIFGAQERLEAGELFAGARDWRAPLRCSHSGGPRLGFWHSGGEAKG